MIKEKYTWEEIKEFLVTKLKKTKHIMTFGTIGSYNLNHDIDVIITKKPESKSSDFYREIHAIFDELDGYLYQKYKSRLIRVSRFDNEEEIKFISNYRAGDLVFNSLVYVSLKQIKMHWFPDISPNEDVESILNKYYNCLLGSSDDLFKPDFKKLKNEYLFMRLTDNDRINSHFPEDFLIKKMNILFDYILRKRLNLKPMIAKNKEEVKKIFYKICDKLDK